MSYCQFLNVNKLTLIYMYIFFIIVTNNIMKPKNYIIIVFLLFLAAESLVWSGDGKPYRKYIYYSHKKTIKTNLKKYKEIKTCEAKYVKRFAKICARRQKKVYNSDKLSSPFFSTSSNSLAYN